MALHGPLTVAVPRLGRIRWSGGELSAYAVADLIAWSRQEYRGYWVLVSWGCTPEEMGQHARKSMLASWQD